MRDKQGKKTLMFIRTLNIALNFPKTENRLFVVYFLLNYKGSVLKNL